MIDNALVMAVLANVPDPEIPVISVVDLGIVRGFDPHTCEVTITPTYSGCPATLVIEASIRAALDAANLEEVSIITALSPAWTSDWINEAGRANLQAYGIAPPPIGQSRAHSLNKTPAQCPQCGSSETREISRFGSTPCKALWQCNTCAEPFDRFKCH